MFKISELEDFLPLRNILPYYTLRDYQIVAALRIATECRRLIVFHTGLGKTLTAIAGIVMRFNNGTSKRLLWITPLSVVKQTLDDLHKQTDLSIITIQGTELSINNFYNRNFESYQVFMINFEAFDNPEIIELFRRFSNVNFFDTVVVDEAHTIANPYFSNRNSFIYMLTYRIENRYLLTATPLISNIQQYASLLALADNKFSEVFSIRQQIHKGKYLPENAGHLISYKSREDNYQTFVHWVKVEPYLGRASGVSIFNFTRGEKAHEVNKELLTIIKKYGTNNFLIHCHYTKHHKFLKNFLENKLNITVGILNGKNRDKQTLIQQQFNNRQLNCIITSLTTGLNLPAQYIIMYDWTVYAVQAAGRGLRKEKAEGYGVHFIITTVSKEITLCENSVIKNGLLTLKALGENPLNLQLKDNTCFNAYTN